MRTLFAVLLFTLTLSAAPVPKAERGKSIIGRWVISAIAVDAVWDFRSDGTVVFSHGPRQEVGEWNQSGTEIHVNFGRTTPGNWTFKDNTLLCGDKELKRVP